MEFLMHFGLGLGLAGAAGIRTYFPLLIMGLLTRFSDTMTYTDPFRVFASAPVLLVITVIAALEIMGERMPKSYQSNQSLLIMALRGLGGAIVFAGTFSGFGILGGILFGAGVAVFMNLILVRLRPDYGRAAIGRRQEVAAPGIEDSASITGTILAVLLPWSSFVLWGIIIFIVIKKLKDNSSRYRSDTKSRSWR